MTKAKLPRDGIALSSPSSPCATCKGRKVLAVVPGRLEEIRIPTRDCRPNVCDLVMDKWIEPIEPQDVDIVILAKEEGNG